MWCLKSSQFGLALALAGEKEEVLFLLMGSVADLRKTTDQQFVAWWEILGVGFHADISRAIVENYSDVISMG